jgi:hypothetical protein
MLLGKQPGSYPETDFAEINALCLRSRLLDRLSCGAGMNSRGIELGEEDGRYGTCEDADCCVCE